MIGVRMRQQHGNLEKNALLMAPLSLLALSACNGIPSSSSSQANDLALLQSKTYSKASLSCNPVSSGSNYAIDYNLGLAARLYYSPAGQPHYSKVEDYITKGKDLGVDLFFNQVNVIPTYFSEGFPSEAGPAFETPDGTVLMEWFGIRYNSLLRLTANQQPGDYQLAILSDDGVIVSASVDGSGKLTPLINNDDVHATKMGCATSAITMSADSHIPIQIDYFQGPRYYITNMLLWRRIPDRTVASSPIDPSCGLTGENSFYDSTKRPSVPNQNFQDLLNRGWEVVPPENFLLPMQNPLNPCYPPNNIVQG